jgi:hypothetical protein
MRGSSPASVASRRAVELVFGIKVLDTGDTFYTGPAARNPDGRAHALVSDNGRWQL